MTKINDHIKQYLDYYISLTNSPKYAVMLNGEWGSGKTWFINNYINNCSNSSKIFLKVSLYGIGTLNDIDDQIVQQLHPILNSKPMLITGKILKSALKLGLKIDVDGDGKEDGNLSIQIPDFKDKESLEKYILVFDDLERSNIEITKVLGYINSFVEQGSIKTIILANEPIISDQIYREIKEKTIGKSFKVELDLMNVINTFIDDLESEKTKKILLQNQQHIIEIFKTAQYNNLRHLYQIFLDFERLLLNIEDRYLCIDELVEELIKIIFSFSFELKKGKIQIIDIKDFHKLYIKDVESDNADKEYDAINKFGDKYSFSNMLDLLIPVNYVQQFFEYGYLASNTLTEILENSKYLMTESTPAWIKLWRYRDLNDDLTFQNILSQVLQQWDNLEFKIPGEILQICGLMLWLSKSGLYHLKLAEIVKNSKLYVDKIKQNNYWNGLEDESLHEVMSWGAYHNLGFYERESKEFKTIAQYLYKQIDNYKEEQLPALGKELLDIMGTDLMKFIRMTSLSNSADQIYHQIPIFKYITPEDFFDKYMKITNSKKTLFYAFFEDRYHFPEISKHLIDELNFLKKLRSIYRQEIKIRKHLLSGHLLNSIEDKSLKNAILHLESLKKAKTNE